MMKRFISIFAALVTMTAILYLRARPGNGETSPTAAGVATRALNTPATATLAARSDLESRKPEGGTSASAKSVAEPPPAQAQSVQSPNMAAKTPAQSEAEKRHNVRLAAYRAASFTTSPSTSPASTGSDDLAKSYAEFFSANNIPPEQQKKVMDILANRQLEAADILKLGRERGLTRQQILALHSELTRETAGQLIAVLGAETAAKAEAYSTASFGEKRYQPTVADLSARCEKVGAPLSPDTQKEVAKFLMRSDARGQGSMSDTEFAQFTARLQAHASTQAKQLLSPQQFAVFEQMQAERNGAVVVKN